MTINTTLARQEIRFSGQVQGVGFRFTARALARDYRVTGYVKNLPNGQVEMVVEGPKQEIARFRTVLERHMLAYIDQSDVRDATPTGEFSDFGIRF